MSIHLEKLGRMVLDFLFPPKCVTCGKEGDFICNACLAASTPIRPPVCPVCILPLKSKRRCDCRYWQSLDGLSSPFEFRGAVRDAVLHLKYQNLRAVVPRLAELMTGYLADRPVPVDILTEVPMHPRRLKERGFNQSELLARALARRTGITYIRSLERRRHTLTQVGATSSRLRRKNVEQAFGCTDCEVQGRRVLLVDDVATTGATLDACAGALKEAGAVRVRGLTLAREI